MLANGHGRGERFAEGVISRFRLPAGPAYNRAASSWSARSVDPGCEPLGDARNQKHQLKIKVDGFEAPPSHDSVPAAHNSTHLFPLS